MCFAALQFFCSVDFSRLWTFRKNLTGSRVSHSAVSGTVICRVTHLTVGKLQRQNEQQRCTWTLCSQRVLWRPSSDCTDVRTPFTWSARLGRWTTRNAARRHTPLLGERRKGSSGSPTGPPQDFFSVWSDELRNMSAQDEARKAFLLDVARLGKCSS